jgi:hypothetical protein
VAALTVPANGGIPYLPITNHTGTAVDFGISSVIVGSTNIVPQTDITGQAIWGASKDAGAYEYRPPLFIIPAGGTKSAGEYTIGNIVFQSDDALGTGQLTGIPPGGLQVTGVVKLEKIFTPKKWYPIGFPFEIASIWGDFETDPELEIYDESTEHGDFWLQSYDGASDEFGYSDTFTPNTGYAIQFPEDFEDIEVTFISETDPTLYNTTASTFSAGYTLIANPSVGNVTEIEDADYYYQYASSVINNFGLLDGDMTDTPLKPFESVVVAKSIEGTLRSSLGNGQITGLGKLISGKANDRIIETQYYNLQGQKTAKPVNDGLYIVKNTYDSNRVEFTKIVYKK